MSPRRNCDKLERADDNGRTYYEARAEELCGNQGGPVPMYAQGVWARHVTITTESYWMVQSGDNGTPVYPDGSGIGNEGPAGDGFAAPGLAKWSLIARWATGVGPGDHLDFISGYFEIGRGGIFDVPNLVGVCNPGQGAADYHPLVCLMYRCNDEDYSDNAGWIHVYETYHQ